MEIRERLDLISKLKHTISGQDRKITDLTTQRDNAEKLCREQANKINQQRMEIQALQAELNSLRGRK